MDFRVSRLVLVGAAFASGLMLAEACQSSEKNSNHCSFLEGDATCADRYPGEFEYCGGDCVDSEHNDGCVGEVPVDCYYPCGGDMLAEDDMSCLGTSTDTNASTMDSSGDPSGDPTTADDSSSATMTMTGDETETDPTETTGPTDCQVSADCTDPERPVCLDNDCVPCTDTPDGDMACSAKDEALPVCRDDGHCVQCSGGNAAACGEMTPVCDEDTSTCVKCTYHEQCPDTACSMATGACIDGVVFHVDGDAGCMNAGAGTEATPFCDIQVGIDAAGTDGIVIVHAAAPYVEDLVVSGQSLAILQADGEATPEVRPAGGGSTLVMNGATTQLYIEGLRFTGNVSTVALSLSDGEAWLDRIEIVANSTSGSGLEALASADVHLRSCIVGGNGDDVGPTFGVRVDGATLDVLASTVVNNDSDAPNSLTCVDAVSVTVRNSIVMTDDPAGGSIACADVTATYSVFDEDVDGVGNSTAAQMLSWFAMPASANYRLSVAGQAQFEDVALVEAGDYPFDVDGDPRPAAGSMDRAGADTP